MDIEIKNLSKSFDKKELFTIPELIIRQGDSLHLEGENGAGKTTLMKIIAGLEKATTGEMVFPASSTKFWWQSARHDLIYMHQAPYLFSGSVIENAKYGLKSRYRDRQLIQSKAESALEVAGLIHLADQEARTLSGGERQRLALARAAVIEPRMLLLDEPTANLDKDSIQIVTDMVHELKNRGCSIMLSSHQKTSLTKICQRTLQLKSKRLLEVFDNPEYSKYA